MAPQRYKISIEGGSSLLNIDSQNSGRTLKNATLPIRIPARATGQGRADVVGVITFVYCREDNTGVAASRRCNGERQSRVTSDANAPAEISLTAKVAGRLTRRTTLTFLSQNGGLDHLKQPRRLAQRFPLVSNILLSFTIEDKGVTPWLINHF